MCDLWLYGSPASHGRWSWLIAILLLCGDVHPNPEPPTLLFNQPRLAMMDGTLLQVIPTPGDGHCFVNLLRVSMETYLHPVSPHEEI